MRRYSCFVVLASAVAALFWQSGTGNAVGLTAADGSPFPRVGDRDPDAVCCLPNGTCAVNDETECLSVGGTWHAPQSTCPTTDADMDGYVPPCDCDDYDADNYPGNTEACDGWDNDCNGLADDGTPDANSNGIADACESGCPVSEWIGPPGGSFSNPIHWDPQGVPDGDANFTNTTAVDNSCVLSEPGETALCAVAIAAIGSGKQTLQIGPASTLHPASGTSIATGGQILLQGGTLAGTRVNIAGGSLVGHGEVSADVISAGSVESSVGGVLSLSGALFENRAAGRLVASTASQILLHSDSIVQVGEIEVRTLASIVVDPAAGELTNAAPGRITLLGGSVSATGIINATGARIEGFGAIDATLANAGELAISADMQIVGDVTNDGLVTVGNGTLTVVGDFSGTGAIMGDFSTRSSAPTGSRDTNDGLTVSGDCVWAAAASITVVDGVVRIGGNVDNAIDDPARFNMTTATLQLVGIPQDGPQTLEVIAEDRGPQAFLPDASRFSLKKLRIGPTETTVQLVDNHSSGSGGANEALYVEELILDQHTSLELAGLRIYYGIVTPADPLDPDSGVTVTDAVGGGGLFPIQPIDCNNNGVPDIDDVASGTSDDCNSNGIPDECEPDCNGNGVADECDIDQTGADCNSNSILDECEVPPLGEGADCNDDLVPDECQLLNNDCNEDGTPDECQLDDNDCNANQIPDDCEVGGNDCNSNGVRDACDIAIGTSNDCNANGVPDECDILAGDPCVQPPQGLLGWWPGEGNAADIVGANSGTLQGGVTFAPGKVGDAFSLDGTGYSETSDDPSLAIFAGEFTVDVWIKPGSTTGAYRTFVGKGGNHRLYLVITPGGRVQNWPGILGTSVLSSHSWYHIVYALDSTTESLYINGALEASVARTDFREASGRLVFGVAPQSDIEFFHGLIDEVTIFANALSAAEVEAIFYADSAGKCRGRRDGNGQGGGSADCNGNGVPDECEVPPLGVGPDCNSNGIPDDCEVPPLGSGPDCNSNGVPDACDIAAGTETDLNGNEIPDSCEAAPQVVGQFPVDVIHRPFSLVAITFNTPIDPDTFRTEDVLFTGPDGGIITVDPPVAESDTVWWITFAEQSTEGDYEITIGPDIESTVGNSMSAAHVAELCLVLHEWSHFAVDFSAAHNRSLQSLDPAFPAGDVTLGGIPFHIPAEGNNYWHSSYASGGNPRVLDVIVGLRGAREVHTIINTSWGQPGPDSYAWLEFFGSEGAYYRKDLIGDDDIRDWSQGSWTNNINGTTTINVVQVGNRRLDKQMIELPAEFHHQTLTGIRLSDQGGSSFQASFLAGVTVEALGSGDITPPLMVIGHSPTLAAEPPLETVDVTFNRTVEPASFTVDDVGLVGPEGPVTILSVVPLADTLFEINWEPQTADGEYVLSVGPNITDLCGLMMDQDGDGTGAEPVQDVFEGSILLASFAPQIISHTPEGPIHEAFSQLCVTFNEEMDATSFDGDDVDILGPSGAVTVTSITEQEGDIFCINFQPQTSNGDYLFTIGPDIVDLSGVPMEVVYDATVAVSLPDLAVSQIDDPLDGGTGQLLSISWTVTNTGTYDALGSWTDRVYLSHDSLVGGDIAVGDFTQIGPLAPDGAYVQFESVTVPADFIGPYWLVVTTDVDDALLEAGAQANNTTVGTASGTIVDALPPDTIITAGPADGGAVNTTSVTFEWTGVDNGTATAELVYARCLAPTTTDCDPTGGPFVSDSSATYIDLTEIDSPYVFKVAARDLAGQIDATPAQSTFLVDLTAVTVAGHSPDGVAHSAVCAVEIVFSEAVAGCDTGDMTLSGPSGSITITEVVSTSSPLACEFRFACQTQEDAYTFSVGPNITDLAGNRMADPYMGGFSIVLPNLTIRPDLVLPLEGWTGQAVDVGWTVTNTGDVPAEGLWQDCVYLSSNDSIGDDTLLGCISRPIDLDVGEHYDRVAAVTIPEVRREDYWIVVIANDGGLLAETDYSDNTTIDGPFPVYETPCADLVPSDLVIQETAMAGGTTGVDWIVTNVGTGATDAPYWHDAVYLSVDETLSGGDCHAGNFQNPMALNAGEPYSQSVQTTICDGLSGYYYVIVAIDNGGNLSECNEDNDIIISDDAIFIDPIPPSPTLTVTNLQVIPPSAHPEDPVTVRWTLTNTGNVATGPFCADHTVRLSADDSFQTPGDDATLATQVAEICDDLGPGEETDYTIEANVDIPRTVWGERFMVVLPRVIQGGEIDTWPGTEPVQIEAPFPADLVIDYLDVDPINAISGEPITATWQVRNAANVLTLAEAWEDTVTLSRDNSLDTTEDNLELGRPGHSGALDFDDTYVGTLNVTLPNDAEGRYYVFVCTDTRNQVYEGEGDGDDNNCSLPSPIDVEYHAPDLQVQNVVVLADEPVHSGTPITVLWTVINNGDWPTRAGAWTDQVSLSVDGGRAGNNDLRTTAERSGFLAPGESYQAERTITVPLDFVTAAAFVTVCADSGNHEYESDEDNNCARSDGSFEVTWGPSDLRIFAVAVSMDGDPIVSVASGSTISVAWQVANDGPGVTSASSWDDRAYLSIDDTLDLASDPVLCTATHPGTLAAQGEYAAACSGPIPINFISPAAYVFVVVDYTNRVVESDTSNNVMPGDPFEVVWGPPDLTVQSVSAVHGTPHGEVVDLSWTVRNSGGPTVAAQWQDAVYLSADRWFSPGDDVGLETPIGPLDPHTGELAYGQSYSRTESITVPPESGGYLIVVTDDADDVEESNEANNEKYTPLPPFFNCDADIVVTSVDAPATALSGQLMTVRWTVTNQGSGPTNASSWRDTVYLSPDQYLDTSLDHLLGYLNHSGALEPRAAYDPPTSFDVTVPAGLTGPYYVFIVTDSGTYVCEIDEGNNVGFDGEAVDIVLPPPADLVVTGISVPATGHVGNMVDFSWTVENQGDFEAQGSWEDAVYLSTDATWDIGDAKVGSVRIFGPLGPNQQYPPEAGQLTAELPGVVPGDYYIIVRTDIFNEVRESQAGEDNNTTASVDTINVQITELTLDVELPGTLSNGEEQHYRVCVPADETLRIILDSEAASGVNKVYVRYGDVADEGRYEFVHPNPFAPDQTVVVPTTQAGCYYVLLHCDNVLGGSADYSLLAESVPFSVIQVSPAEGSRTGSVTFQIEGARFERDTYFTIVDADGVVIRPVTVYPLDASKAFVTFDLRNAALGSANLTAASQGSMEVVLEDALRVVDADSGRLITRILPPSSVRIGSGFVVQVEYANIGNADIPAPVLELRNAPAMSKSLRPEGPFQSGPMRILGINFNGPAGILPPGQGGLIPVYFGPTGATGSVQQRLTRLSGDRVVNWAVEEQRMQPTGVSDLQWQAIWTRLRNHIGNTWGDLEQALGNNATRLWLDSKVVYAVNELLDHELDLAWEIYPSRITGTLFDAETGDPLLGVLVVARSDDGSVIAHALSEADGHFEHKVSPGMYDLFVDGYYLDPAVTVQVTPDEDVHGVVLEAVAIPDPEPYEPPETPDTSPALTTDAEGNAHLVFKRGEELYHAVHDGTDWAITGQVGTATGADPQLTRGPASAGTAAVTVLWQDGFDNESELYFAVGTPGARGAGYSWTMPEAVTDDAYADESPAIVFQAGDQLLVVWLKKDAEITDDTDVYWALVDTGGSRSRPLAEPINRFERTDLSLRPDKHALFISADQYCVSWPLNSGTSLPSWVPIIGGKYGFEITGGLCTQLDCDLSLGGSLGISVDFSDSLSGTGNVGASADWMTDETSCEYLFNRAEVTMGVGLSGTLSTGPIPIAFPGLTIEAGAALSGQLQGTAIWQATNFPGWPSGGHVDLTLGADPFGQVSFIGLATARLQGEGRVTGRYTPPQSFGITNWCLLLRARAYILGYLVGHWCKPWGGCGAYGINCDDDDVRFADDRRTLRLTRAYMRDGVPIYETFTVAVEEWSGTGSVYPGTTLLPDVSTDVKHDGPPSVAVISQTETLAAWTKDSPDPSTSMGTSLNVAAFDGAQWGVPVEVESADYFNIDANIVVDQGGTPMLVWSRSSATGVTLESLADEILDAVAQSDIYFAKRTGGLWSTPAPVAELSGTDRNVCVAGAGEGEAFAAWLHAAGDESVSVYASVWDGVSWNTAVQVSGVANCLDVACAYGAGAPILVWEEDTDGDIETAVDRTLYYAVFDGISWYAPEDIPKEQPPRTRDAEVGRDAGALLSILPDPPEECCDECADDYDCDDSVDCTEDACVNGSCVNDADDGLCPDDWVFCNGDEYCDPDEGCLHRGDPCPSDTTCNEDDDTCDDSSDPCENDLDLCCGSSDPCCDPTGPCCGSNDPCCGSTDPCCGSSDPCCSSSDPCCGSNDPCCGSADSCCDASSPCCGSADSCCDASSPCCGDSDSCCDPSSPCCGSSDSCCDPSSPCCGDSDSCCDPSSPCCGSSDSCCDPSSPCCGDPDSCCDPSNPCCGSPDSCCDPSSPCCGDPDSCCDPSSACCGSPDSCCDPSSPCCGDSDLCCDPSNPCCGSNDPCCDPSNPCCGDPCCGSGGGNCCSGCPTVTAPSDPNEKIGPGGFGEQLFVSSQQPLPFTVYFENVPDAGAWAAEVSITDQLSPHLDKRTFQLGEIAFGDTVIEVPDRRPHFFGEINLDNGLIARLNAGIDIESGVAEWTLTAIDPDTGEMPSDPTVGLLPPNDPDVHDGEGHVTFTVRPLPDLPTGTEITNSATIIFDINEPIETNEVFNTIDSVRPTSSVSALPAEVPAPDFDVQWSGQDDDGGSGIGSFTIYAALDDDPESVWLTTLETVDTFTGARGGETYSFHSVAEDNVGNLEDPPEVPDTTTTVAIQIPDAPTAGIPTAATATVTGLGLANVDSIEHTLIEETTGLYVSSNGRLDDSPLWQPLSDWPGVVVRALLPSTEYRFKAKARSPSGSETEFGPMTLMITSVPGDVNGDGLVTQADVDVVQGALGTEYGETGFDARADLNGDDEVTYADLGMVMSNIRLGDFNHDGHVRLDDYAAFWACFTGPASGGLSAECVQGDFDLDDDVDLADIAAFELVFDSDGG